MKLSLNVREAAIPGAELERVRLRRMVATQFFDDHIHQITGDWEEPRRALQTIDFTQPVSVGPPGAPARLFALKSPFLNGGFFAEQPGAGDEQPVVWQVPPNAPFLKWFAFADPRQKPGSEARYFIPAARQGTASPARRIG